MNKNDQTKTKRIKRNAWKTIVLTLLSLLSFAPQHVSASSEEKEYVEYSGPQSYRNLQRQNQEAYARALQDPSVQKLAKEQWRESVTVPDVEYIQRGPTQSPLYQATGGKDYWGNSIFDDKDRTYTSSDFTYEGLKDARSQNMHRYLTAVIIVIVFLVALAAVLIFLKSLQRKND